MAVIKCVGCRELVRETAARRGRSFVIYTCQRYLPFWCTLSGLLRPGTRLQEAVRDCPWVEGNSCALCAHAPEESLGGEGVVYLCEGHLAAWSGWLNIHPGKREYIRPNKRPILARWVEVFREFMEDARRPAAGRPENTVKNTEVKS